MLWIAGYFQVFLVVSRFIFNFLNFVPAAVCLYYSTPTENCTVGNQSRNILGRQEVSNTVNTIGALLEDGNSLLLLSAIFSWKIFHVKRYFRAIIYVGHFWVWCLFCITNSLSVVYVDIVHGKDNTGEINVNAIALITEMFLLTLLASAVNFIAHDTYANWVANRFWGQRNAQRVFKPLFRVVLSAYFFRNLGLFLYDTALVSMSISLLKGGRVLGSRDWDSLLLLLSAAFRASFTKFFFEKMFQGQQLPPVCDKEAVEPLLGPEFQSEQLDAVETLPAGPELQTDLEQQFGVELPAGPELQQIRQYGGYQCIDATSQHSSNESFCPE